MRVSNATLELLRQCGKEVEPQSEALLKWHRTYVANHISRLAFDLALMRELTAPSARVLEVGSVPLVLTAALAHEGYAITGCDLEPARYAGAISRSSLKVIKCNVEHEPLPFLEDSFDVVLFNEIFEHLRINPIFTLREVKRVLRPGGLLLLSSPNLRSLNGLINFLWHNRAYSCSANIFEEYNRLDTIGHMGHVREYTTTEVIEFLQRIGFEVTRVIYRGRYSTPGRRLVARFIPSLLPFATYVARKPA